VDLRSVHLVFITLSTLLAVFLAVWTLERYAAEGAIEYGLIGILSSAGAVALAAYGIAFRRRSRHWWPRMRVRPQGL
jgi:hypothetical protein